MKRLWIILFCLGSLIITLPEVAFSQYDDDEEEFDPMYKEKKFDASKISVGGFFAATFGDVIFLDISPVVAYRIHERVQLGTGVTYQYINYREYYPEPYNKANTVGGRLFGRFFVWDELYVHLEYAPINADIIVYDRTTGNYGEGRKTYHNVFAGGGYNVPMGRNSYLSLMLLVNLTENALYPRRQPFFNVGFGIGL